MPFDDDDDDCDVIFEKTRNGDFEFQNVQFGGVSHKVKDLITHLLIRNVDRRLSAEEALKHEWMTADNEVLDSKPLTKNLSFMSATREKEKARLRTETKETFKQGVKAIMDMQRLGQLPNNRMQDLEEDFARFLQKKKREKESIVPRGFTMTSGTRPAIKDDDSSSGKTFSHFYDMLSLVSYHLLSHSIP